MHINCKFITLVASFVVLCMMSGFGARPQSLESDTEKATLCLLEEARSMDREAWFPAARELGQIAASDSRLSARIWKEALVNTVGMRFVRIDAGEFVMGPAYTHPLWPKTAHRVRLTRPFYISVTETTNEQYAKLTQSHTPNRFSPAWESPVVDLSWNDVQTYCRQLSEREQAVYRLPTEAEWEYVCRAGVPSPNRFGFGDDAEKLPEYAWYYRSRDSAAPVAMLKPNHWGVYDMHGNVLELVQDWFTSEGYESARAASVAIDPGGPTQGLNPTLRGGEWYMRDAAGCECGFRIPWPLISIRWRPGQPQLRETIGFRIVREADPGGWH